MEWETNSGGESYLPWKYFNSAYLSLCTFQDKAVQALKTTGNKSVEQALEFLSNIKMLEGKNGINKGM